MHLGWFGIDDGNDPMKVKARVTARIGFVSFHCHSMYSEQNTNTDKHKMVRFLAHGRHTVASFYGLAVYNAAPRLLSPDGVLVATGSALRADPGRIVLKRVVLLG